MADKPVITQRLLRQLISFHDGKYFWKERALGLFSNSARHRAWNTRFAGKETLTCHDFYGYARVSLLGHDIKAHRLIWMFHYGQWPDGLIDHINGVRSDNRLENLRVVSPAENNKNIKLSKANTSGYMGVRQIHNKRWLARIKIDCATVHLGYYATPEEAVTARRLAEIKYGYHPNHGSIR